MWDSKDALTYFVRDSEDQRTLVTIPRKDVRVGIVAYDDYFACSSVRTTLVPALATGRESHE